MKGPTSSMTPEEEDAWLNAANNGTLYELISKPHDRYGNTKAAKVRRAVRQLYGPPPQELPRGVCTAIARMGLTDVSHAYRAIIEDGYTISPHRSTRK